jgi:membrane protein
VKLTQRASVRRLIDAWERLRVTNGNQYAAAITYFSFLAIFPLILFAVSIAGFVLHANQNALHTLFVNVGQNVPGELGDTLKSAIRTAVDKRASVGIIGLAGVLLTGLGWMSNLRASLDAVWKRAQPKENFFKKRLVNLGILVGLGIGVLISLGLTAAWAAFSHRVLSTVGLADIPGMGTLLGAIGIAVTVLGGAMIFYWVLVRVPRVPVRRHIGLRGAVMAAVGFEVLKIAGTYTIAASVHSPTAGPFAGIIAVLVWIQLVTRWMLFCAAWMAELSAVEPPSVAPVVTDTASHESDAGRAPSPAAVGAGVFAAGALVGALAVHAVHRRTPSDA